VIEYETFSVRAPEEQVFCSSKSIVVSSLNWPPLSSLIWAFERSTRRSAVRDPSGLVMAKRVWAQALFVHVAPHH
jgi:hypothetical protein